MLAMQHAPSTVCNVSFSMWYSVPTILRYFDSHFYLGHFFLLGVILLLVVLVGNCATNHSYRYPSKKHRTWISQWIHKQRAKPGDPFVIRS
eukprot:m.180014 g.180014  ORF g.180014 m.180014 type:complete len:91 (+) comp18407_c0_seq1:298-570(+)